MQTVQTVKTPKYPRRACGSFRRARQRYLYVRRLNAPARSASRFGCKKQPNPAHLVRAIIPLNSRAKAVRVADFERSLLAAASKESEARNVPAYVRQPAHGARRCHRRHEFRRHTISRDNGDTNTVQHNDNDIPRRVGVWSVDVTPPCSKSNAGQGALPDFTSANVFRNPPGATVSPTESTFPNVEPYPLKLPSSAVPVLISKRLYKISTVFNFLVSADW